MDGSSPTVAMNVAAEAIHRDVGDVQEIGVEARSLAPVTAPFDVRLKSEAAILSSKLEAVECIGVYDKREKIEGGGAKY